MGIARLGDKTSGHGGFHPTTIISASGDVFVNGKGVARIGDALAPHTNGKSTHGSVIAKGASNVYVNGRPCARIGDHTSCGDTIIGGSGDVFGNE